MSANQVKAKLDTHEAVCAERWKETITRIKRLEAVFIAFSGTSMVMLATIIIKQIQELIMTTNSEARQIAIRAVTSTTALHNEDWIALFNTRSIAAGTFNERLLTYINGELTTSYTDVNLAIQAFATDQSDYNFSSMGTFTP